MPGQEIYRGKIKRIADFSELRRYKAMNTSLLFAGLIFGLIGTAYFIYGKKQQNWVALVCGIMLCVIPYVIANTYLLIAVSIILAVLPFFIKV